MPKQFSPEFRARALRLLDESIPEHASEFTTVKYVATKLGVGVETLRKWKRQADVDAGVRPGTMSEESAEIRRLKRENQELRRANEILKSASAFFAAELDRPSTR